MTGPEPKLMSKKARSDLAGQIEDHLRELDHSGPTEALTTAVELLDNDALFAAAERAERCEKALARMHPEHTLIADRPCSDCDLIPGRRKGANTEP